MSFIATRPAFIAREYAATRARILVSFVSLAVIVIPFYCALVFII